MRTVVAIWIVVLPVLSVGCRSLGEKGDAVVEDQGAAAGEHVFLTVDFEPEQTLRYGFVSEREIALDWDPNAASSKNRIQKQSERLEMVVAYTPLEVDPYGFSTIRAVCESVQATRSGGPAGRTSANDAVQSARGKAFTLKVDSRGRIVDGTELEALIKQMGDKAFRAETSRGRVKEPDMIADFIASQWFLWDAVASVPRPVEGVALGQTWESQILAPTPMVIRLARDVTYKLDEIRPTDTGRLAVIAGTYTLAETVPSTWPVPYAGRFQMSGTFGFLGAYQALELHGAGQELFDIDAGRVVQRSQKYRMEMRASLPPMGIRANPHVTIDQTLTMKQLNP